LLTTWAGKPPKFSPYAVEGVIQIFGQSPSVQDALTYVIDAVSNDGYIAIMAYVDRKDFGWDPRFLHSTGQVHNGVEQNGVFLQITGEPESDIEIPRKEFTFTTLITAQALGDGQAIT
jgi:uncharacterized radical SAM superfamily Fe-S cluster-containing enzyme